MSLSHVPRQVVWPLWLLGDRRIQNPGIVEFPPSESYRPDTAPYKNQDQAAVPGPDHVPEGQNTKLSSNHGDVTVSDVTLVNVSVVMCHEPHLSIQLFERSRQTQDAANICS